MADLSETHRRLLLDAGTALGTFLLLVVPLIALGIPEEAAASGALVVTGIAAAPVTVPLTLAAGGFALLCSLFE